uniref:adenylate cyclase n=1 Tax=Pipistrellus kuhlii TaxID=59472 RepID=A0A7J8B165_PIPKU|nr:hypothetical protein mPipKuh1_007739 [Pipistrellus kuhlii]
MARLFSPRPPPSEDLFYETYYSLSQQYPLLLLLLAVVLCALLALLAVAWASGRELASDPGFLTTVLCALGGFSLLLGLASCEQRLQRWTRALSGLVWAALLALGHGFLFTGGVVSAWDQVSFFLFVIFTTYAMLPLGMRDATVAGLTSSLSHLLVLGLYLGPQRDSRPALLPQLAANAVLFLCGNVAGAYHKALMERALRATFREALSSLHSRRRLDTEKKHQEHLLLSILPAYLAREMKAEIMARLQAGQGSRPESTNNFHSLYVKRHQGVSVLYADIVGFTRLASECSPKELVLMLNELFGKFDQIAKSPLHTHTPRSMNACGSRSWETVTTVSPGCPSPYQTTPSTACAWGWTCAGPSGNYGQPPVWTSTCAWACTRAACSVESSGCRSGSTMSGPMTSHWPTTWRQVACQDESISQGLPWPCWQELTLWRMHPQNTGTRTFGS